MITSNDNPETNIRRFLADKDIAESTKKVYEFCLRKFHVFLVKQGLNARKVKAPMLLSYKKHLKENEQTALYINLNINVLRSFYKWQFQQGIRRHDIGRNIRIEPVVKRHRRGVLTEVEVRQLLESIDQSNIIGARDYAMILLAYSNGLRAIELSRLSLRHIDLAGKTIEIRGKGIYDIVSADLSERTANAIENLIQLRANEGETITEKTALFTGYSTNPEKRNTRIRPDTISKIIGLRLKAAGLKSQGITSHSLRHSAAVHLIGQGASLHLVSLFLRHSSIKITEIYTHHSNIKLLSDQKPSEMLTKRIINAV
jgi:site-specific recombinase XerD